ncbi:MAG: hypothetical protein WCK00_07630, partial [Deltaproteobacteria bacterium]
MANADQRFTGLRAGLLTLRDIQLHPFHRQVVRKGKEKINNSPAPLYLVMVDHGDIGQFHIGADVITPIDLKTWLATLEGSLSPQAVAEKRIIIIGACHSGSFIKD